jgi:hypothetical protein
MNDLQLTLLISGGGGLAAMIAYNWWQDYRLRKQASERFGHTDQDPLLNSVNSKTNFERTEPGLITEISTAMPSLNENWANETHGVSKEIQQNESQAVIDRRLYVDFLIHFDQAKDSGAWKSLTQGFDQINRKRIIYSVSPDNSEHDQMLWFKAASFTGMANFLKVSVQIANRKGPLSSIEFSEVLVKLKRLAEEENAEIDFPEMKDVVTKAETLDQAAAALDTLLGLHCLLPETTLESTAVDLLTAAGWQQNGHHWFLSHSAGMLASMVIHNAPGKRLLSFSIDVPNSAEPVKALGDIVTVCHRMNEKFGAPLMDDSGHTLNTQAIEDIYEQLIERVRDLTDSGFKPGSQIARTLFS